MKKKLAIIGSGRMAWIFGKNAQMMGVETHAFSFDDNCIAKETVTAHHLVDIMKTDEVLHLCQSLGVNGVVATTELTVPVASYVAQHMGLPCIPYDKARVITDKYRNRKACAGIEGLEQPGFVEITDISEFDRQSLRYPLILKPTSKGGKRGITVVDNPNDLEASFQYAKQFSGIDPVIIEEYIEGGQEYSVESLSCQGRHYIVQITQKISSGPPHCVELGHQQPAQITVEMRNTVKRIISSGLSAIGVENGACHTEIKIADGKVWLIEFNARPGGDHIAWPLTELSTGYPYIKGLIEVALGEFQGLDESQLRHDYAGVLFVTEQTACLKPLFDVCEKYDWLYWKNEVSKELLPLTHNDGYHTNFMMYYSKTSKPDFKSILNDESIEFSLSI